MDPKPCRAATSSHSAPTRLQPRRRPERRQEAYASLGTSKGVICSPDLVLDCCPAVYSVSGCAPPLGRRPWLSPELLSAGVSSAGGFCDSATFFAGAAGVSTGIGGSLN